MSNKAKKIAIIGTGLVGMSYAYSLLNQGIGDVLVLIDINKERAIGEAMDLNHGLAFAPKKMTIYAGDYEDTKDCDLIVITAGVAQKEGETRIDLLKRNAVDMKQIVSNVMKHGFNGIFLVATNPVDILSHIVWRESRMPASRVIGSGTILDTARLRYEISNHVHINSKNIHAYILGEHGDSEFVCWSNASISVKPLLEVIDERDDINLSDMEKIYENVRDAAYNIISKKNATYYGIGMSLARITKIIIEDQRSILPVSTLVNGQYDGVNQIHISVPAILGIDGVIEIVKLNLNEIEIKKLKESADIISNSLKSIGY